VLRTGDRNEWDGVIRRCLAGAGELPAPTGPDPFSLADLPAAQRVMQAAGFASVTFTHVAQPVYYGPDVAAALDWVSGFACTAEAIRRLDPAAAAQALQRLRQALATHLTDDGVWFDSRAWIITAVRR
jgi:hypothetical protein